MFKQTENKYRDIPLGFGTGTIYQYGCYLVSLCNGLNKNGYSFTPESLNDLLKSVNAWVGPYRNYIDVDNLHKYFPNIFESYQRIDPWGDVPPGNQLLGDGIITLGRVSGVPIGGSGDHFVLFTGFENGVVKIFDPWSGVEELITKRWAAHGYIRGVRIFNVKKYEEQKPTPIINDKTKIDMGEGFGEMEVQAIRSALRDQKRAIESCETQLKRAHEDCSERVQIAVGSAESDRDEYWQPKLDTANETIEILKLQTAENLPWSTLFSIAWKKWWSWKKSN